MPCPKCGKEPCVCSKKVEDDQKKGSKEDVSAEKKCIKDIKVTFNASESQIMELWDLWIDERPTKSIAKFDITTEPPNCGGVSYEAEVIGDKGVVKKNVSVTAPAASSSLCSVSWDGTNDKGDKVDTGKYKVKLTAKGGEKTASDTSTETKILRVGIVYIRFKNVYPLKFAFKNYPTTFVTDNFEVPAKEWKIASLDDGSKPRTPPVCQITGKGTDADNYCYPFAAKRKTKLRFRVGTEGRNYASTDGIQIQVVRSGTDEAWSDKVESGIDIKKEYWFEANDSNKLPNAVAKKDDLHFDFLFNHTNSQNKLVKLGRQTCSKWVIYVIVSQPTEPWGLGGGVKKQKPWVELLEWVCTKWAKGAQTVEGAAGEIVEAVNHKMTLKYDTADGEDKHGLVTDISWIPENINLRTFLGWLKNNPIRPTTWNVVNCTCCGALVSTIANSVGCSLNSSIIGWNFKCHKIISIGFSAWEVPFPTGTSPGEFNYHEVAWTGSSTATDDIYDACLQVATDPVNAEGTNPLYVKGMVYKSATVAIDDYVRRLVKPSHLATTNPDSAKSGRYKAV